MKVKVKIKKTIDIKFLRVNAKVRYFEDTELNGKPDKECLIPFKNGDYWCPLIDIDKGIVVDWPEGNYADIHYKVCDAGEYFLEDEDNVVILSTDGYVPEIMCPNDNGYGDYIIMKIDPEGKILNWPEKVSIKEFKSKF